MIVRRFLRLISCLLACAVGVNAADRVTITVVHDLAAARPAETITVPWAEISRRLPGALLQRIAIRDAAGHVLPYQVTNIAPQAKDPQGLGLAYGDLIFQHDFAAGEKIATFTVEKIDAVAPVFPTRTFARQVPERLDDFAWENDKIGHRTYGPALAAPAPAGVTKEVLVTSGLDVWCKRVNYPIVDRWYNKGHDHYHKDQGEGMDMYQVGGSRGCGGTGVWDGHQLAVSGNYRTWKILANGPIRSVFELTYEPWAAGALTVTETKRFIVDAGHSLDRIESTFTVVAGSATTLPVAIGLNKTPADKGQDAQIEFTADSANGLMTQWMKQKTNGELGTAIIVPSAAFQGFAEDERNQLLLTRAVPGQPLVYYAGAGWSKAGEFTTRQAWLDYVAVAARRARAPIRISLETAP